MLSESREVTFDTDIGDQGKLESILRELTRKLCDGLGSQGMRGRTVGIKVRLDNFKTHTRDRTLPAPVSSFEQVWPVALELLCEFAASRPLRLLGVRLAGLEAAEAEARQLSLSF